MKKVLVILTAIFCFFVTASFAVDGAALYKKKCAKCHLDGTKSSRAGGGAILKGQGFDEILLKLNGYLDGSYGGKKKKTMGRLLKRFSPEEIKAMSEYIGDM